MLTTPPGTSDVASTSPSSIAARGCASDATTTATLPPASTGASRETSPSSAGSPGATIPTTPVGSGTVKLKYGPATGFAPPSTWLSLSVQPAYQTIRSMACSTSVAPAAQLGQLAAARLEHLGDAVEHLAAVVRRHPRPLAGRAARDAHRVAQVLARGLGDVVVLRLVGAARTPSAGTRRPGRACRSSSPARGSCRRRSAGRARVRAGRPRGRSPTPCSRRTATSGRSG